MDDWEDKYNQYLNSINKRIQNGTATANETKQIENLEYAVMIYDLMMKNIIEENGTLSFSGGGSKMDKEMGLALLIDRATRAGDMDSQKLKATLQQAIEKEDLELNQGDGRLAWKWRSFLSTQKTPKRLIQSSET